MADNVLAYDGINSLVSVSIKNIEDMVVSIGVGFVPE